MVFDAVGGQFHKRLLERGTKRAQFVYPNALVEGDVADRVGGQPAHQQRAVAVGGSRTALGGDRERELIRGGGPDPRGRARRLGDELIHRAVGDQLALADHDEVLGGVLHLRHQVAGDEDSTALGRDGAVPGGPPEKRGTLERANNGTLFLDEIGDMSLKTQAKVLRSMDEQRFTPVGTSQPVSVDVRIIAATNKNLEDEIARGNFREDLFYRLNVIPFYVPPLRDRREDIPILVREFLSEFGREYGRPRIEIGDDALSLLKQYHWPGNVRELRNLVERLVILNPQVTRIERKHLPMLVHRDPGRLAADFNSLQEARNAYERDFILKKVDECHGNMSRAAEALGLDRTHLYRKMKALGISARE